MKTEELLRPEDVCAITVIYANRFDMLHKNISALLKQGIGRIVVINNGSHPDSRNQLQRLASEQKEKITVIDFERNQGLAKAFSRGMAYVQDRVPGCSHLWLLDDDLLPKAGALQSLLDYWQAATLTNKRSRLCLAANRDSGRIYRQAVFQKSPWLILGRANSFWGFHFKDIPGKLARRLIPSKAELELNLMAGGEIEVAPYGGLFFHKDLLATTGYPREEYFLYVDDYDFTYRVTRAKGSIQLVLASHIEELEPTWEAKGKGPHIWILAGTREFRKLYYTARNLSHFLRHHHVALIGCYLFNISIFLAVFSGCALLQFNPRAIRVMVIALRDGLRGRLGENRSFH